MPPAHRQNSVKLASAVDNRQPAIVALDLPLVEVIALMSQAQGQTCPWPQLEPIAINTERPLTTQPTQPSQWTLAARHRAVVVLNPDGAIGIITDRDLVTLIASQTDIHNLTAGDIAIAVAPRLYLSAQQTAISALAILQQHQIRHLPILDDGGDIIGIATPERICQILQPVNASEFRAIAECMTADVVCATPTMTIGQIARLMRDRHVGSIVIVQDRQPVGIVTAGDIVTFGALAFNLERLLARAVMSTPLHCLQATDSLRSAQQLMQAQNIRRLAIVSSDGNSVGILTQSDLLRTLDPWAILAEIESGQQFPPDDAVAERDRLERTNRQLRTELAKRERLEVELRQTCQLWERQARELAAPSDREATAATSSQTLRSLQFLKYALDRAAIVAITDRHGTIVEANDKFCEISQYSAAELVGKTHRVINSGYHPPEFFRELWAVISSGRVWSGEIKNRAKDGSYYWVATTIVPHLDEGGRPYEYLAIRFDITNGKRAEANLQRSERRFRAIFDGSFEFMGLLDPQGNVLEANRTALAAIGATPADVIGQAFWTTPWWNHDPDLQRQLQQAIAEAATGRLVRFEAKHLLADGSSMSVDFSLSPIVDDTGRVVMLIPEGRDITEQQAALRDRLRAETAHQQSEARFGALLSMAPVGIFQSDTSGNCLFVNQQCSELMGRSTAEALGQGWVQAIHPGDRERVVSQWHGAMSADERSQHAEFALEYRFLTPTGRVNWVATKAVAIRDERGEIASYLGTIMDLTDRKIGAQKIREQAALLNIATDAIVVRDLDSQIEFWNHGAQNIYGWSAAEAIGQTTVQLFYPNGIPEASVQTALATVFDRGAWQGELHKNTKSGKKVIVESRWTLVRDEAGQPRAILSVDTDITDKKQLEQQFLRAQRLESLGSLASGIAHDLNNVLTPIVGAAQLLPLTLPSLDDRSQRLLNMLVESAKRGSGLVKQILNFARGMDGQQTTIQVRHILAEVVSVARQTFPKSIEINLNLPAEDLWLVSVDATQIHQVLMNLFVNARDAMPNGGTIAAKAENIVISQSGSANDVEHSQVHFQPPVGSYILISITDTGSGMTAEVLDRIFEPFFTTKEAGTGLGLSTVLGIIKAHGGTIDVASQVGRGTCFKIYLPAVDSREAEPQRTGQDVYDGKGRLVLVVDDEVAILEITKASLEAYNYRVLLASDGVEAIAIFAANHHSIAVVLVDMMMPHLDTPSTILALQQIDPEVKIAVMSGLEPDRAAIDRCGVRAILTKPFTTMEMLQMLESI
ncbi:PAS domain S-box protein [Chamaesiphon minutus]|uniref:histidine kinase n=1 Tax=Chamaesiphon minutus (strain ATCC 27169 / PCC 6605) TaxID=1173020 RepID=K9UIK3_CHAP6|nr:PAS domain S-box protein [Chamaesiphon minutus]AFY94256.1 PAS domain S-box [Chamaesiphon minutus PCC 6605]